MHGSRFRLVTPDGEIGISLSLPGLYNVYNAVAAAACCTGLGISLETIQAGLEAFSAAFGRVERLVIDGKDVCLLLVKNPAGFNEVVRTLMVEPGRKSLLVALNDKIADGRDISWIWDVDLEMLAGQVEWALCSGTRAAEMAMRLKYAGIEAGSLRVREDLREALQEALNRLRDGETLYITPTYTAMLALRQAISQHFSVAGELGDLVWK
jgi:UDP-N-acetylmuramyl tripeptide synthase